MKWWVRLTLYWFVPKINFRNTDRQKEFGPTLLVANHPNSFLDALLIAVAHKRPLYFLARGDAFNKPWHRALLRLLNMYPVYRIREGRQHVHLNRTTFQFSNQVLQNGGTLLIFIEGICLNTHELQPFKKGAARIALEARNLPGFHIMPVGVAYSDFNRIGKAATVCFGNPVYPADSFVHIHEQANINSFNEMIFPQLKELIQPPEEQIIHHPSGIKHVVLIIARILNYPLYYPLSRKIASLVRGTVFYDSILFAALLFAYPVYCLLFALALTLTGAGTGMIIIATLLVPVSALYSLYSRLQLKYKEHAVSS
jgi:1-acyl-sn-glycerol-3-phosphate acyltransferase